jgi:trk system potassium uptake protein TrkA
MPKKQAYAVIGLGRFGSSVAYELNQAGQEVMGMDINEDKVEDAESIVTHAIVGDSTDVEVLKSAGIRNFDCVIVAIGNDMQSSILTTLILKELGVKKVIAKATSKTQGRVLEKVGADWVIYPERDMGSRVAHQLMSPNVLNYIQLSEEYNIEELKIPSSLTERSLRELDLRAKYNISVIAIVCNEEIIITPSPDHIIHEGDLLVVIGSREDLAQFVNIQ